MSGRIARAPHRILHASRLYDLLRAAHIPHIALGERLGVIRPSRRKVRLGSLRIGLVKEDVKRPGDVQVALDLLLLDYLGVYPQRILFQLHHGVRNIFAVLGLEVVVSDERDGLAVAAWG
jgi:hypothetical protein